MIPWEWRLMKEYHTSWLRLSLAISTIMYFRSSDPHKCPSNLYPFCLGTKPLPLLDFNKVVSAMPSNFSGCHGHTIHLQTRHVVNVILTVNVQLLSYSRTEASGSEWFHLHVLRVLREHDGSLIREADAPHREIGMEISTSVAICTYDL